MIGAKYTAVHKTSETAVLDLNFKTVRYSALSISRFSKTMSTAPVTLKVFSFFPKEIIGLHHKHKETGGAHK